MHLLERPPERKRTSKFDRKGQLAKQPFHNRLILSQLAEVCLDQLLAGQLHGEITKLSEQETDNFLASELRDSGSRSKKVIYPGSDLQKIPRGSLAIRSFKF